MTAGHTARRSPWFWSPQVLCSAGACRPWEKYLPAEGLRFDASTAQATPAIAGDMITLAGFVVTAITLVVQTVLNVSPRPVGALGHSLTTSLSSACLWAPPCFTTRFRL